jgi:hypothetical protein
MLALDVLPWILNDGDALETLKARMQQVHMQQLLTQMNLYTLTDRCPQAYGLQNYTYIATKGEKGVQVCKSVVDYIVALEHMYKASAVGGVQQDQWEISGSAHRVLWARLPVAKEVAPPKPRQKPYMKWRVERL